MKAIRTLGKVPGVTGVNVQFTLEEIIAIKDLADSVKQRSDERTKREDGHEACSEVQLASIMAKIYYNVFDTKKTIESLMSNENIFAEQDAEAIALDKRKKEDSYSKPTGEETH